MLRNWWKRTSFIVSEFEFNSLKPKLCWVLASVKRREDLKQGRNKPTHLPTWRNCNLHTTLGSALHNSPGPLKDYIFLWSDATFGELMKVAIYWSTNSLVLCTSSIDGQQNHTTSYNQISKTTNWIRYNIFSQKHDQIWHLTYKR